MKKIIFIAILLLSMCACFRNDAALNFKKEYESLNGKTNKNGKEFRNVSINEKNPYEKVSTDEIIKKINNKETFYVYFGDKLCPWCRSVIEKSVEIANQKNIKKIYYVAIWDDDGNEIVRDKYEIIDDEITQTIEGDKNYSKLLDIFSDFLNDYTLTNSDGEKVIVGEKRIYAPNFLYIEEGIPKKLITGISEKQTGSNDLLTDEILLDEEKIFKDFFK